MQTELPGPNFNFFVVMQTSDLSPAATARPLVTILIPVLNEERYIARCLESILDQAFDMSRCEIIVVDGRSTDRSAEIVRQFAARDPRIRLLDNPDRIQAAALNVGVRASRGAYVLQMDAHSSYKSDYVAQAIDTFEKTGAHNIAGLFISNPGDDTRMARAIWLVQASRFGGGASYGRQPGPARFVGQQEHVTSGWSFRRAAFEKVGLFDRRPLGNHDVDISVRIHQAGLGVYYQPAVVANYYARRTAGAFARVMWRNGHYLVPMWMIRPGTFALVHAVPAIFVLTLLLGLLGGLLWKPMLLIPAAATAAYAVLDLAFSIPLALRNGPWLLAYLPWLFPMTHLSYGFGTLWGIVRFGLGGLPPNSEVEERIPPLDPASPHST